jgi:hypothetical protein
MTAGNDTANGAASSLTDRSGCSASRITRARRVGSDSAAKVRSSAVLRRLTIWFSIEPAAAVSTAGSPGFAALETGYLVAASSATAALTSFTPSSLDHSAGPAMVPISQPERSTRTVVGMPKALPAVFRSSYTWALSSE